MFNSIYKIIKKNTLLLLIVLFILLATTKINNVGILYDELLHTVSAQKILTGNSYISEIPAVAKRNIYDKTFPLMILYYVGPLKTYAMLPFLSLNTSFIDSVRIFSLSAAVITILLTYQFSKTNFSKRVAIITTLLLIFDPSFLFSSSFDWGPTSVQNLLKITALISLFKILQSPTNKKYLYLLAITSSLLIWDKLNAIWLLFPLWTILLFNVHRNKLKIESKTYIKALILGLTFLLPFILFVLKKPYFYYESSKSFKDFEQYLVVSATNQNSINLLLNYSSKYSDKIKTLNNTINGTAIPNHILVTPTKGSSQSIILFLVIVIYPISRFVAIQRDKQKFKQTNEDIIYILIIFLLTAAFLTPHANGPHHFLILWPLHLILISSIISKLHAKNPKLILLLLSLMVASNLLVIFQFKNKTDNQNNIKTYWKKSSTIQLTEYLEQNNYKYIALDWGITLPVAYYSNGKVNISDLQPFYLADCKKIENLVIKNQATLVMYDDQNKVFSEYYSDCKSTLDTLTVESISIFKLYSAK